MQDFRPCVLFFKYDEHLLPSREGNHNKVDIDCRLWAKKKRYDVVHSIYLDPDTSESQLIETIREAFLYVHWSTHSTTAIISCPELALLLQKKFSSFSKFMFLFETIYENKPHPRKKSRKCNKNI